MTFPMIRRPDQRAKRCGFTLVEIMIVVLILAVLLNIAMPSFIHARDEGQARACISNLRRISGAKEEYALDHRMAANDPTTFLWTGMPKGGGLGDYIRGPQPKCPTNSPGKNTYVFNPIGVSAQCPYGAPASDPSLTHLYTF